MNTNKFETSLKNAAISHNLQGLTLVSVDAPVISSIQTFTPTNVPINKDATNNQGVSSTIAAFLAVVAVIMIILVIALCIYCKKRKNRRNAIGDSNFELLGVYSSKKSKMEPENVSFADNPWISRESFSDTYELQTVFINPQILLRSGSITNVV